MGAHSWLSQFDEKLVTFQMFSEFVNDAANHSSEHLDDFLEALNLFFETTQELTISDHIMNDDWCGIVYQQVYSMSYQT